MLCYSCKQFEVFLEDSQEYGYALDEKRVVCLECISTFLDDSRIVLCNWLGGGTRTAEFDPRPETNNRFIVRVQLTPEAHEIHQTVAKDRDLSVEDLICEYIQAYYPCAGLEVFEARRE